ncbi:MAG: hypothetical protein Q8Q14_02220 [Gemmatimonadales bacterium]|nr:hypothetical protein [Gemmatimonadales bacterium]
MTPYVRAALDELLSLTERTPALIECCPPLTDAIARLTHALVVLEGQAPWPPGRGDTGLTINGQPASHDAR